MLLGICLGGGVCSAGFVVESEVEYQERGGGSGRSSEECRLIPLIFYDRFLLKGVGLCLPVVWTRVISGVFGWMSWAALMIETITLSCPLSYLWSDISLYASVTLFFIFVCCILM